MTEIVFSGVNETLFAYGQTGSGKTHTIFGGQEHGLLELFVRQIFDRAQRQAEVSVHLCCYEVLGDALTDLVVAGPNASGEGGRDFERLQILAASPVLGLLA